MLIVHIAAGLPPGGGIAESVPSLCRYLRQLGHEVVIATLDGPMSEAALAAEVGGVRLLRFRPKGPRSLYFSWQMLRQLRGVCAHADVVHVHSQWTFPVWWGCWCALRGGKKLVMTPRGCLDPVRLQHSAWKKRLVGWIDRYFLRRTHVIHVTAECEREWVRAYLASSDLKIVVIPNGVDIDNALKGEVSFNATRSAQRGLEEPGLRTVLYLGRLHPLKGLDLLMEAWARLSAQPAAINGFSWRLVIAGSDEQGTQARLERQAAVLGLHCGHYADTAASVKKELQKADILFAGPVYGEQKARLLAAADLFVLPTRSENFGIVVAEALACGVPVITTKGAPWQELLGKFPQCESGEEVLKLCFSQLCWPRTAGCEQPEAAVGPEVLHSGLHPLCGCKKGVCEGGGPISDAANALLRSGWWVDIGVEPLVEALQEAMALTDAERREMGQAGRRLVEAKYQWSAVARSMAAVYAGIATAE